MGEADEWRDYETNPPAAQDPAGEWIEVPVRCKMKGTGTVRGYVRRPPGRTVRIVCSGEATVRLVTVYRMVDGQRCPFSGIIRWLETYSRKKDGTPTVQWIKRPYGQAAKCAEAEALRKAFPAG